MRRLARLSGLAAGGLVASAANADLATFFSGFQSVNEVGLSGLKSSYDDDSVADQPISGLTVSSTLPTLGPARVFYPSSGEAPSGGHTYDAGVLGFRFDGEGNIIFRLATGMNPQEGFFEDGNRIAIGDLFVSTRIGREIHHFALLTSWARIAGTPQQIQFGVFDDAQAYHLGAGVDGGTREGNLVHLDVDADVRQTGGGGTWNATNAPDGLDIRCMARGGEDLGDTNLTHDSTTDNGQDWFIQTWTVSTELLAEGDPAGFSDFSVHATMTCGNDQIAIPEPASLGLLLVGAASLLRRRA